MARFFFYFKNSSLYRIFTSLQLQYSTSSWIFSLCNLNVMNAMTFLLILLLTHFPTGLFLPLLKSWMWRSRTSLWMTTTHITLSMGWRKGIMKWRKILTFWGTMWRKRRRGSQLNNCWSKVCLRCDNSSETI